MLTKGAARGFAGKPPLNQSCHGFIKKSLNRKGNLSVLLANCLFILHVLVDDTIWFTWQKYL
jgi:hypothetical protein